MTPEWNLLHSLGGASVEDLTFADTLAASHSAGTLKYPNAVVMTSGKAKRLWYKKLDNDFLFNPFVLEIPFVFSPQSLLLITEIGRRLLKATKEA